MDKATELYDIITEIINSDEYPIVMVLGVLDIIKAELLQQVIEAGKDED